MAIGNVELVHECFYKHLRMGTTIIKEDKETEQGKKRGVSMERSNAGTKKNPDYLSIWKKYNEIQLTKNKMET